MAVGRWTIHCWRCKVTMYRTAAARPDACPVCGTEHVSVDDADKGAPMPRYAGGTTPSRSPYSPGDWTGD